MTYLDTIESPSKGGMAFLILSAKVSSCKNNVWRLNGLAKIELWISGRTSAKSKTKAAADESLSMMIKEFQVTATTIEHLSPWSSSEQQLFTVQLLNKRFSATCEAMHFNFCWLFYSDIYQPIIRRIYYNRMPYFSFLECPVLKQSHLVGLRRILKVNQWRLSVEATISLLFIDISSCEVRHMEESY